MRFTLDKSKEISTSNSKIWQLPQIFFCNLCVLHSIGSFKTLIRRHLFNIHVLNTHVKIFHSSFMTFFVKFNCLESLNRCTCSSPLDIDLTLLRGSHSRAKKALNIWHLTYFLTSAVSSLLVGAINGSQGQDIMIYTI